MENVNCDELRNRMADMRAFLLEQPSKVEEYDEILVRLLVEMVTDVVHVGAGLHNKAVHAAVGDIVDEMRVVPVAGIEDEFFGFVQRLNSFL